jgi:hypothetical protein
MPAPALVLLSFVVACGCARSAGTSPSSSSEPDASLRQPRSTASAAADTLTPAPSGVRKCSGSIVASLQVQVKDAVTGASICDPLVMASVGAERTQLRCYSRPDCVCSGVNERLGTFQLTVSKAGYSAATTTAVVDQTNGCHVIPKFKVIRLQPLRSKRHPP